MASPKYPMWDRIIYVWFKKYNESINIKNIMNEYVKNIMNKCSKNIMKVSIFTFKVESKQI